MLRDVICPWCDWDGGGVSVCVLHVCVLYHKHHTLSMNACAWLASPACAAYPASPAFAASRLDSHL